jgi:signal peptidase II
LNNSFGRGEPGLRSTHLALGRALFLAVALTVFGLDRLTKYLVVAYVPDNTERGPFLGVLWIQHLQNSCAAFSLCGPNQVAFLAISLVVVGALLVYELQQQGQVWVHVVLGLVWGGVLGNGFDRLLFGSVTDFLAVHWWPTFNIADSAISVGVAILAVGYLSRQRSSG